jgi:hypothetical protein
MSRDGADKWKFHGGQGLRGVAKSAFTDGSTSFVFAFSARFVAILVPRQRPIIRS